jgi:protein-S-isoprenylcysteine O-methyltransferase Ste14
MNDAAWLTRENASTAIGLAWLTLALVWAWMSRSVKRTAWRESRASRLGYISILALGFVAMVRSRDNWILGQRMLPESPVLYGVAILLTWAGVLFAIRARMFLGSNWSGTVTVKEDHELIRSGPYRWVRHPIYSGLLLASAGVALESDRWVALIGFALVFTGLRLKSFIEEQRMLDRFGDEYDRYRCSTRALIPFLI